MPSTSRNAATVLAGLGLRFSEAKTRVTHLSEGIDFLRLSHPVEETTGRRQVVLHDVDGGAIPHDQADHPQPRHPRRSPRPLTMVIWEVNAALRGWTYYFRPRSPGAGSRSRYFTWRRFVAWRRRAAPMELARSNDGSAAPTAVGNPSPPRTWCNYLRSHEGPHRAVPVSRSPHPQSLRPDQSPPERLHPRGEPVAVRAARRVRRAACGNRPGAIPALRRRPTQHPVLRDRLTLAGND